MRDFIITSLQTWDIEIGSTIKNTALEISKQNRVLYINTPMDISIRLRGNRQSPSYIRRMAVIKGETSPLRQINANMWVLDCPFMLFSANFLPAPLFNIVNRKNNARIARWIVEQAAALDFKNYIHLIDTDIYRSRYLKEYIHPSVSIYYRRDYVIGEAYWRRHGTRLEPELAASADLVLANSTRFAAELQAYNPHTYPIETGVNLKLYNPAKKYETPGDMQDIPRPIIGYMGTINSTRLDGDLLYQIISQRPDYSFVFTGPEDDIFRRNRIHSLKNAYFTGQKKVDELPAYIAAYDVCINPQMVNEITDGNYPLKIDEYLAMGKPTVATSTHTMRHIFANHTHLATTPEEWLSAIDRAVTEADDEEPLFNIVNRKNNARIARWIVEQAAALDFKNYIHLIDTDIYRSRYLKEYIHPSVSIYYRRDYVIGEAYWRRHGTRLEPELAASADLVLANSTRFAAELQAYNPHTYPIETGVNLKLYNPAKKYETPGDMQDIPRPIIGYMGTINSTRLDGDLLYQIISQRPDYSFVFTGPEDDIFRRNRIHSLKNAYFTGQKKVDELPAYIAAYDVCINPQMVNEITDGNYPLKIDEYLAMGKPTVATSTHTMRHIFANHTHLATTPEEWLSAIDRAVTEADDEELAKQRIAFAETHSWGHSVKKIYDIIDNFLKEKAT